MTKPVEQPSEQTPPSARRKKAWIPITILFAIFVVPVMAAWMLYLNINRWQFGTTQHGEFIKPARALTLSALPLPLAGGTLAPAFFKGRFTLVYLSAPFCNADCEEALYLTRQVRYAMGQKIESVQRLYLVEGAPQNPAKLLQLHPDLTVADVSGHVGQNFARQFNLNGKSEPDVGRFIYLVDPRGFYILRYSISGNPKGLLKDLEHLLGQGAGM